MRNKFEVAVSKQLPGFAYEAAKLSYTIAHTYCPDFIDRERKIMVEAKGRLTDVMRRKYVAVAKQNPTWQLVFCFQDGTRKISKRSKTTYAQWAVQHGFKVLPLSELGKLIRA